jgi:redox-sensitive bicupin YhaK (pirin superfamily)
MIQHRPFAKLGQFDNDWLKARYHFSFSDYYDPERLDWGALRVWNDDTIAPHTGFGAHPHRDMEIITYVRKGAISHRDSLGNQGRTEAGDVQVMSAGSGVTHAEQNLEDEPCLLYQIWITPSQRGGPPHWETARFPKTDRAGELVVLASGRTGDEGALPIRQDARVLGATLEAGQSISYEPEPGRSLYLALADGEVDLNAIRMNARDGAAIRDEAMLTIRAHAKSEIVLVDAP